MTTILERSYPEQLIAEIIANHLRVAEVDGELFEHARMCVYNAFDAAEEYTNRVIVDSLVTFSFDTIEDSVIEMPSAPIREIVEVRYYGADDKWHTIEGYDLVSNTRRALLDIRHIPALSSSRAIGRVEIDARCGFDDGDARSASASHPLPGGIEQAVMLTAGTFFNFTEDNVHGSVSELPTSAKSLLHPYRIYPYGA